MMRYALHLPEAGGNPERPLVGNVEALDASRRSPGSEERDEAILDLLRQKLLARNVGNRPATQPPGPAESAEADKYEPQRLSRKICWQYDASGRKVPLLRRHYI